MNDLSWFDLRVGSKSQENKDDFQKLIQTLAKTQPNTRQERTLANTVTSLDIKLAYSYSEDKFVSFIIGDINANPEGITTIHEKRTDSQDVTTSTIEAYLHNLYIIDEPQFKIVVSLPSSVYQGEWVNKDRWLTHDKKQLVDALRAHPDVEQVLLSKEGTQIHTRMGELYYKISSDASTRVDGYVNLNDIGTSLRETFAEEVSVYQFGSNAPSGVWDPQLYWTSKVAMLQKASEIVDDCPRVHLPWFQKVKTLNDIDKSRKQAGGDVVLKGPFGTHGDEVITINDGISPHQSIQAKETEIRNLKNRPGFELYNETNEQFSFNARSPRSPDLEYGHVEQAIQGTFERSGKRYRTVEVPANVHPDDVSSPIDLLPLVVSDPKTETLATVPSILLRVSDASSLNANKSSKHMDFYSLKQVWGNELQLPSQTAAFNFRNHLEQIANRSVSLTEVKTTLQTAATAGLTTRNISAFVSEQKLSHYNPS